MKKFLCMIMIIACTFYLGACNNRETGTRAETCVLKWVYPGIEPSAGSEEIYQKVNDIIQQTYPHIRIDFEMIRFNEYAGRIEMYNSSKEKIDIAYGSDFVKPYYGEIYTVRDKLSLDEPIRKYTDKLSGMLSDALGSSIESYRYNDKLYCLPNSLSGSGVIPYLKIPHKYIDYFDCDGLYDLLARPDTDTEALYSIINSYLYAVKGKDIAYAQVDYYSLIDILPRIGYRSVISTYDLLGYKMSENDTGLVCLKTTDSYSEFLSSAKNWQMSGMISEDIDILHANNMLYGGSYLLDAGWGYYENGHFFSFADDISLSASDYCYIPLGDVFYTNDSSRQGVTYIHADTDYREEAVKVLELFYDNPVLYRLLTYGIEGRDYTVTEDYAVRKNFLTYTNIFPHYGDVYYDIPDENVMNFDINTKKLPPDNAYISSEDSFYWLSLYDKEFTYCERKLKFTDMDMTAIDRILNNCKRR